jgi:filamentous hemagglutinin family protein
MKNNIKISKIKNGFLIFSCFFCSYGIAEVTHDGSMGAAGTLNGLNYQITEDRGNRVGNNLFHSFGQFNLNNTESATFSGSAGINNVIGRVTGGQASNIDGTLRVTIPDANLYLLNPAGIIFGENVKLDVSGSFHASTADFLKFQDGVQLNTGETTANPILTAAEPEAFGFLGNTPANISLTGGNNTVIEVANGKALSLVGGDINIKDASLYAPGGQINLVSVGSAGEVRNSELGLNTASFTKMGDINISQDTLIPRAIVGQNMAIANIDVSADKSGKVFIHGGQMVMENAHIKSNAIDESGDLTIKVNSLDFRDESEILLFTIDGKSGDLALYVDNHLEFHNTGEISVLTGNGEGGDLEINAGSLFLREGNILSVTGNGKAGDLTVNVDNHLEIRDGGEISTAIPSSANSQGGDLTVNARSISIVGDQSNNFTGIKSDPRENNNGRSGNLSVSAIDRLEIRNGGQISASTLDGKGGDLEVNAQTIFIDRNQSDTFTGILSQTTSNSFDSAGGDLTINVGRLEIHNGGEISASTFGNGDGGDLNVYAKEILINRDQADFFTGITNQAKENGFGNTGNLTVNVDHLDIISGGEISSSTLSKGNSGNLKVDAQTIVIDRGQVDTFTGITNQVKKGGFGNAGDLTLIVDHLDIHNGGQISASTCGHGNGGNLIVESETIFIDGGLTDDFTGITNQAKKDSSGNAGDLTIITDSLEVRDNAQISASTFSSGIAGNLILEANNIFLHNSKLVSKSEFGNIDISKDPDVAKSGNIKITVNNTLNLESNASISVETNKANAGMINIEGEGILKASEGSKIITSVANGEGKGGDISIITPFTVLDGSSIKAQAVKNAGGNITISGILFKSPHSIISASSELSMDGEVTLKPDTNISDSITTLPDTLMNAPTQISERCATRSNRGGLSSFVVKERVGLPSRPGELAPSKVIDYSTFEKNSLQNSGGLDETYSNSEKNNQLPIITGRCTE